MFKLHEFHCFKYRKKKNVYSVMKMKYKNTLTNISCFVPQRETQGDGKESPEEESPLTRSPSDTSAQTGS